MGESVDRNDTTTPAQSILNREHEIYSKETDLRSHLYLHAEV